MKAIITDLDRTLLRTDKTVSEYTRTILKKCRDRGIVLMAATARPQRAVLDYQDRIGFEAMTTLNGARIILPQGVIENGIRPSSAESILEKVAGIPDLLLSVETGKGIFSNEPIAEWNAAVFDRFPALPTEGILYKILLSGKKGDIRQEVQRALPLPMELKRRLTQQILSRKRMTGTVLPDTLKILFCSVAPLSLINLPHLSAAAPNGEPAERISLLKNEIQQMRKNDKGKKPGFRNALAPGL